jgi:hypothetical protein
MGDTTMTKKYNGTTLSATRCVEWTFVLTLALCWFAPSARASILTFDISDVEYASTGNFPEGYQINQEYGDRIADGSTQIATNGTTMFQYGVGAEGYTPNVTVSYGPFSIFTGGPELWRTDYGDLEHVLYQGSRFTGVGNDYDILDIVLVADPGYDVVLYDFDLGGWNQTDYTINAVTVYDGVPFPFITPTNQIYNPPGTVDVAGAGPTSTHIDFGGTPQQAHVIWLQINANNLGSLSENIGIDNIRFGQVENGHPDEPPVDPADIDGALQDGAVPEAASVLVWLGGLACVSLVGLRRERPIGG